MMPPNLNSLQEYCRAEIKHRIHIHRYVHVCEHTYLKDLLHERSSFKYYLVLKMIHPLVVLLKSHTKKKKKRKATVRIAPQ